MCEYAAERGCELSIVPGNHCISRAVKRCVGEGRERRRTECAAALGQYRAQLGAAYTDVRERCASAVVRKRTAGKPATLLS